MAPKTLLTLLPFLLTEVSAHGYITSPAARQPGQAFGAACGSQALSNQASDIYGNIQGIMQVTDKSLDLSKCNLWQCKGFEFSDQSSSNVQAYTAGQSVPIHFDIRAPHDGVANISIVDTASNTIIGSPLMSWAQFALTSVPIQADQEDFSITIPSDLGGKCAAAGECVIQMFWDARSIDQTYESCIDFTVGGSGNGSDSSGSTSGVSSVAETTTTARSSAVTTSSIAFTSTSISVSSSITSAAAVVTTTAAMTTTVSPSTTDTTSVSTSAASSSEEIFTLTAGTTTMLCREEL